MTTSNETPVVASEKKSRSRSRKPTIPVLGFYRCDSESTIPFQQTSGSACFDIRACITPKHTNIEGYTISANKRMILAVGKENQNTPYSVSIPANSRALIPTGLILDIPSGYCVHLYSRSGMALKSGLTLANGVGIIDSDYINEVMVILENKSDLPVRICHGDRIAQAKLVKIVDVVGKTLTAPPGIKTNRTGGFGSTGKA